MTNKTKSVAELTLNMEEDELVNIILEAEALLKSVSGLQGNHPILTMIRDLLKVANEQLVEVRDTRERINLVLNPAEVDSWFRRDDRDYNGFERGAARNGYYEGYKSAVRKIGGLPQFSGYRFDVDV